MSRRGGTPEQLTTRTRQPVDKDELDPGEEASLGVTGAGEAADDGEVSAVVGPPHRRRLTLERHAAADGAVAAGRAHGVAAGAEAAEVVQWVRRGRRDVARDLHCHVVWQRVHEGW